MQEPKIETIATHSTISSTTKRPHRQSKCPPEIDVAKSFRAKDKPVGAAKRKALSPSHSPIPAKQSTEITPTT